jgi:hypothetical protein
MIPGTPQTLVFDPDLFCLILFEQIQSDMAKDG